MKLEHIETEVEKIGAITYRLYIEPEEAPVHGHLIDSGDPDQDKADEEEVIRRLDNGDTWAWASVKCEAKLDFLPIASIGETISGVDYLSCCSYKNVEEFLQSSGYWEDMKMEAKQYLVNKLTTSVVEWLIDARIVCDVLGMEFGKIDKRAYQEYLVCK